MRCHEKIVFIICKWTTLSCSNFGFFSTPFLAYFLVDKSKLEHANICWNVSNVCIWKLSVNMQMCCHSISNGYILLALCHKMLWQMQILKAPMNYKLCSNWNAFYGRCIGYQPIFALLVKCLKSGLTQDREQISKIFESLLRPNWWPAGTEQPSPTSSATGSRRPTELFWQIQIIMLKRCDF